jgi:ABC-type multidrug transport system fused ATPase/permease subunit
VAGISVSNRKPPKGEHASLRVMYGYIRPRSLAMIAGTVLTLATSASALALPLVVRKLIVDLSLHRGLTSVIVIMCVLILFTAAVGSYGNYVLRRSAESIVLDTRKRLVDRLLRLTIGALDRNEPGDLISRSTTDTTLLRDAIASCFVGSAVGLLTVAATLVIMGLIDWLLLAVTWGALTGAGLVVGVVVFRIQRATVQAQESVGAMGAALDRALGAFRTVKACGAEPRESKRVYAAAVEAWRANLSAAKWEALVFNTAQLAMQVAFLAALATGGAQVTSGAISVGTLVAFLLYVFFLMSPIGQLVIAITQYQVAAAAVARIQQAERLATEQVEPAEAEQVESAEIVTEAGGPASVEFEQVRFGYRPELPEVHHGVSFVIPPGGMTAFVGPSGAGKTTVFSLIERFYEPDSGRVLVDGVNARDWPLGRLRSTIGYVEQDAPVLSGTLRENLLYGEPEATGDELADVLRITRLTDLVERLPDGLETQVGYRGTRLSGGERQRVAIARALLRHPRLLLLDEATSQLDAINEAALRDTVADVAELTTVLVVAHRLSTVTMAKRILVMDAGRVQATGTHAELVAASPLYAELATTQFLVTSA